MTARLLVFALLFGAAGGALSALALGARPDSEGPGEALHGEGTAEAMTARYQRAWIKMAKGDLEGAREFMRQVSRSASSPSFWRLFSRANAADFSIRMGDTVGVRQDLEEFKIELENTEGATAGRVMAYVDRLLEQLDG